MIEDGLQPNTGGYGASMARWTYCRTTCLMSSTSLSSKGLDQWVCRLDAGFLSLQLESGEGSGTCEGAGEGSLVDVP